MAREVSVACSLVFDRPPHYVPFSFPLAYFDVAGKNYIHNTQNIGATEEALLLGDATVGGWFMAVNRHATAVISLRQATSASDMVDLKPGEPCLFRLSADATAPFAISTVAGAELEYVLVDL